MVRARGFEPPMWEYPGRLKVYYTQPLCDARIWWNTWDLNPNLLGYEPRALTNWTNVPYNMLVIVPLSTTYRVLLP